MGRSARNGWRSRGRALVARWHATAGRRRGSVTRGFLARGRAYWEKPRLSASLSLLLLLLLLLMLLPLLMLLLLLMLLRSRLLGKASTVRESLAASAAVAAFDAAAAAFAAAAAVAAAAAAPTAPSLDCASEAQARLSPRGVGCVRVSLWFVCCACVWCLLVGVVSLAPMARFLPLTVPLLLPEPLPLSEPLLLALVRRPQELAAAPCNPARGGSLAPKTPGSPSSFVSFSSFAASFSSFASRKQDIYKLI